MNSTSAPSTPLGDALGHSVRSAARVADYHLPLGLIWAYQRIPAALRLRLFGGPSMSVATARAIRTAGDGGWRLLVAGVSNHPDRPALP